jgi:hypothetical protein
MTPPILLPPTFQNSFWSQDGYRSAIHTVFHTLDHGCTENTQLVGFIREQATCYAPPPTQVTLSSPSLTLNTSLSTIQAASEHTAQLYRHTAQQLHLVAQGFENWGKGHEGRVTLARAEWMGGKKVGAGLVGDYQQLGVEVAKVCSGVMSDLI